MAAADTARLIASLELQDKNFSRGLTNATRGIDRVDKKLGAFSGAINRNLGRALDAGISRGVRALTNGVTGGLESLATLEDATTSVDGAIKAVGLSGKVTAGQVATWANDIERDVHAAFDDKDILASTENLIRYGDVTADNIKPAMVVMTDLAARTGDVGQASKQLGKALADPTKASGALRKAGIVLTKEQQKQIDVLVEAGKKGKAQALVLDLLRQKTEGAADASQGKYRKALSTLADVSEDAKRALAEGFLPVIERVADKLETALADPKTMTAIRTFGSSLAQGFDKAIDILEGVDWNSVGAGLKSAAEWAGKIGSAFMGLPAEAKGIIIGLAGLTKLTGGAPIKIAVDFAKDALGGVFGHFFDRGASPANPMWVAGKGIGGAGDAPGPGGTGITDLVKFGITAAIPIAVATAGAAITKEIGAGISSWVANGNKNLETVLNNGFATFSGQLNPIGTFVADIGTNLDSLSHLDRIPAELGKIPGILGDIAGFITGSNPSGNVGGGSGAHTDFTGGRGGPPTVSKETTSRLDHIKAATDLVTTSTDRAGDIGQQGVIATDRHKAATIATGAVVKSATIATGAVVSNAATGAGSRVTAQSIGNTSRIVGAIGSIPAPVVNVDTDLYVSATSITRQQTTVSRTTTSSSRTSDDYNARGK